MEVPGIKQDGTISKGKTIHDFCQTCYTTDQLVPAVGFCQDCQYQLCQKCYYGHTTPLLTWKHRLHLLSSAAAAQPSLAATTMPVIKGTLTCPKHPEEVVEFYCIKHETAVCATCIYKHHMLCDTEDLTAVPDDFYQSNGYSSLSDTLRNYNTTLDLIHSNADKNITYAEQSNDDALKELNKAKNKVVDHFNEIEKALITAGKQDKSTDVNSMKDIKAECQAMKSLLTEQQTELQCHEQNTVDLYVTSMHALDLVDKLQARIESLSKIHQSVSYKFKPDAFIQTITTTAKCLGTIERTITPTNIPLQIPPPQRTQLRQKTTKKETVILPARPKPALNGSSPTKISDKLASAKVKKMKGINVKNSKDWAKCIITGIAFLPPSKFLVADCSNKSVKCVDTSTNTITSYLKLSGDPWDVTVLPNNLAAVTLNDEKNIQILSTAEPLSCVRTIKVTGRCSGITSTKDKLIVSYHNSDDPKVEIMDIQGHVLYIIQYDQHNKPLFERPWYVAVSGEEGYEAIYVSDWETHTVTKLTMTGRVLFTHTDKDLVYPRGLTVTQDGQLLICSQNTGQVQLVSPDGEKMRTLISRADGLDSPVTICASAEQNMIYISRFHKNSLKVYNIE